MRPINVFVAILTVAPLAVSARGTLGFALGAQNPDTSCKSTSDYEKDFQALQGHTTLVRTYSASNCDQAQNIIPAAQKAGFQVLLGVWLVRQSRNSNLLLTQPLSGLTQTRSSTTTQLLFKLRFRVTRTRSLASLLDQRPSIVVT
jgi:exo-beta-1,3-glucanase (GH17 family)